MSDNAKSGSKPENWTIASADKKLGIAGPISGSVVYESAQVEWEETPHKGIWLKSLYHDKVHGERTMLMKLDPGSYSPSHTHANEFEQVFVIEGSFFDEHTTLRAGDHCCRTPDSPHGSRTDEGALALVIYTPRK